MTALSLVKIEKIAKRRIKQAKITHISLVPRGANRMPVIFKADDSTVDLDMLIKADNLAEKGEITAIVYSPEARDTQGDIASAEVIKDMMYDAAKNGVQIDMRHDGVSLDKSQAFVAVSFIVQKSDPRFEGIKTYAGKEVNPVGAWGVVLKIDDPVLRQKYRDGEWTGVSMGGTALVEAEKSDDMAQRVLDALIKQFSQPNSDTGDLDMTPEELLTALAKNNEILAKSIVTGITEASKTKAKEELEKAEKIKKEELVKTEEKAKKDLPAAPVFKGDVTNAADLLQHQRNLALFELRKDTDMSSMESVNEYTLKLAEFVEAFGELTEADRASIKSPRFGLLKAAASSLPISKDETSSAAGTFENVSKEDQDLAAEGFKMAHYINIERGMVDAPAVKTA